MRALTGTASRRFVQSALKRSARSSWRTLPVRSLTIAVCVGHGNIRKGHSFERFERTPEQTRAALAEYERMTHSTERLLGLESLPPASVQELRVAFHYWVSGRARLVLSAKKEESVALQHAENLLDWMLQTRKDDPNVLQTVFQSVGCASGAIINMIELYLMPFRGTAQSLIVTDRRLRFQTSVNELKDALRNATRVMDRLQLLLDDPLYSELVPDSFTVNMTMNLWLKRCCFLAEHRNSIDEDFIRSSLKGVSSVEECLKEMEKIHQAVRSSSTAQLLLTATANSGLRRRAEEADKLLCMLQKDSSIELKDVAYNTVLSAYASEANPNNANAAYAMHLLNQMKAKGVDCSNLTFSSILLAHANSGDPDEAIDFLHQIEAEAHLTKVFPNSICYNIVLHSLAKLGTNEAINRADGLLGRMHGLSRSGSNPAARPDIVSYTCVIQAWARSKSPDAAKKAESLLLQCTELAAKNSKLVPDIAMYNVVLDAWSRHGASQINEESGAQRAESLFCHMKGDDKVGVDGFSYNILMNAWFRCEPPDVAANRARELMDEMKRDSRGVKPDVVTYNTLIKILLKSRQPGSVEEARQVLKEMEEKGYKPNSRTYNTIIAALVKSGAKDAVAKAEEMISEMEQKFQDGNTGVRPDEVTFNILLHGHAKSADPDSGTEAEYILSRMLQSNAEGLAPSAVSYGAVLDAYARSGKAKAAESMLRKMSSKVLSTVSYNTVLNALSKSKERDSPQRAEALLNRMQEEYEAGNEEVRPNQISFSSLLNCWARSDQDGAAERAEAILKRMEELGKSGNRHIAPNVFCYSAVLNAWSRSRDPESDRRAVALLDRMEEAYHNGNSSYGPNDFCYNTAMNAIAKSSAKDKATKSYALMQRMIQAYKNGNRDARPNVMSFTIVLNACAYTYGTAEEKREAYRIARTTFAELLESDYGKPSVVTYVNFLVASSKLLPPGTGRNTVIEAVYRECAKQGLVNVKVDQVVSSSVSPDVFDRIKHLVHEVPR